MKNIQFPKIPSNIDEETYKFYENIFNILRDMNIGENPTQLILNTYAGYGSTDTKIMRFTNKVEGYGTAFSENHTSGYSSNAKGLEITINKAGKYSFTLTFTLNAAGYAGISLNSTQLTTAIYSINVGNRLSMNYNADATAPVFVSWAGRLKENDIIRVHNDGVVGWASNYEKTTFIATYLGP